MLAKTLDNRRLIALFSALLIVAGLASYSALPTTEDPHVMNRVATVLTPFPGATAERVEALVTEPIEDALRTLPEVDVISSSSQAGLSVIRVELKETITAWFGMAWRPVPKWGAVVMVMSCVALVQLYRLNDLTEFIYFNF